MVEPRGGPSPSERAARRQSLRQDAVNIPNLLTALRIVVIPGVLVLLDRGGPRDCYWAAILYAAAAITDFLDGWLARRMNLVSVLGKFLDPLADKLIVMATLVWMVNMGRIETWVVVLLLTRELGITGLRSIASTEGMVISAGDSGKAKTALQMVGILCLIVGYPYRLSVLGLYDLAVLLGDQRRRVREALRRRGRSQRKAPRRQRLTAVAGRQGRSRPH
jgi:CDP-diacylglycerol--glycerol-3-phosphate 3-phosphatidyltransferase